VTGSALIGLPAIWEGTGHHVPDWVVVVAAIAVAAYFVWLYVHKRAEGKFDYDLVEVPEYANVYVE
jgi:hypothetical protein